SFTGCSLDQIHYGCLIKESVCRCGFGCKNEYKYRTRRICINALRSAWLQVKSYYNTPIETSRLWRSNKPLSMSAFKNYLQLNNFIFWIKSHIFVFINTSYLVNRTHDCYKSCVHGVCIPTDAGYVCNCNGTNHYGDHCEKACPGIEANGENIPRVCGS
ncbi:uncharacterized protein LOC106719956, partial [Papilio machaon]|uniref:uncharacterized protein LOC106719956 n=1 Tax=Papilio machaon TaxID=76193 RepID=UPI001E6651E1